MKRAALIGVALAAALAAPAAAQVRVDRPLAASEPTTQSVEQKRAMLAGITANSSVSARIGASSNAEARRLFQTALDLQEQAATLLASGRVVAADALLNEALWQIGRARALTPDPAAALVEEKARYQQLQESIAAMGRSYEANLQSERRRGAGEQTAGRRIEDARALLAQAGTLGTQGNYAEANRLLERSLELMLLDFKTLLGGQTLIYSRTFPQPQDEYPFELERNKSYESLVPLAVTEFRPGDGARAQIDRHLQENAKLRERAARYASERNLRAAVRTLQEATDILQQALQAAGLEVPQVMTQ